MSIWPSSIRVSDPKRAFYFFLIRIYERQKGSRTGEQRQSRLKIHRTLISLANLTTAFSSFLKNAAGTEHATSFVGGG
jgi:hypothetical protein